MYCHVMYKTARPKNKLHITKGKRPVEKHTRSYVNDQGILLNAPQGMKEAYPRYIGIIHVWYILYTHTVL